MSEADPNLARAAHELRSEAPPEPQPWWRLWARWRWLLGAERSELEVQAFVGTIYTAAAGSISRIPGMALIAEDLRRLRRKPDMVAAMACERLYYETLTDADRAAELWNLRERFDRVASDGAKAAFRANQIADPAAATPQLVVSEMRSLLAYSHKSYELTLTREIAIARLKGWLLGSTIFMLIAVSTAVYHWSADLDIAKPFNLIMGLTLIALTGGTGAVMSVARRLQAAVSERVLDKDPLFEIAALELGRSGIVLSCLIGTIFAVLLFALFYGGLGEVFFAANPILPNFAKVADPAVPKAFINVALGKLPGISHALGLKSDADLLRMLAFAFVAGFAERLVPDAIDRIISQKDKTA